MFDILFPCCTPTLDTKYSADIIQEPKEQPAKPIKKKNFLDDINNLPNLNNSTSIQPNIEDMCQMKTSKEPDSGKTKENDDDQGNFGFGGFCRRTTKFNDTEENSRNNFQIKHKSVSVVQNVVKNNIKPEINIVSINHMIDESSRNNEKISRKLSKNSKNSTNNKKQVYHKNSIISFANIVVNKSSRSKSLCDTEILNPCEIVFLGDIFNSREVSIDRLGIKSQTDIGKRKRKDCYVNFGIVNPDNKDKNEKYESTTSSNSPKNFINKNYRIDFELNFPSTKLQKILDEYEKEKSSPSNIIYNNINKSNKNIILFSVKYNPFSEFFEFFSFLKNMPVELLLNFRFNLRYGVVYDILVGNVPICIKPYKNYENESIIEIIVKESDNKKYTFNPTTDKMPITIGRTNCSVNIGNISVSKTHSSIKYSPDKDEFIMTDSKSTNGTYLLMKGSMNKLQLTRDYQFRICESRFAIKYINTEV